MNKSAANTKLAPKMTRTALEWIALLRRMNLMSIQVATTNQ